MRTGAELRGVACAAWLAGLAATPCARAASAVGDWGHFLSYTPTVCLLNPDGRAFEARVHVMQWGNTDWRRTNAILRLTAPDGTVIADGPHTLSPTSSVTLNVPAGKPGVYRLHTTGNVWVDTSLDRAVVWTGEPGRHLMDEEPVPNPAGGKGRTREHYEKRGHLVFQASVPRRWWFWVPPDATAFRCVAMRADRCMSQREDWGFFVITPRGQRIRALWGQPPHGSGKDYRQEQSVDVEVEPGAAGRFWCLDVGLGDSHQYTKVNIAIEGVPPYLARSPEEWFDPTTGTAPEVAPYDETAFMQSAPDEATRGRWPSLQHFSPCPSLGDPDGIEILGDARFALWNPDGRELGFRIGTYLPRPGLKEEPAHADVRIVGPSGEPVLSERIAMRHIHGNDGHPTHRLTTGRGVATASVSGVERWLAFTYPATPLVLVGDPAGDWTRFRLTVCAPRNWYFFVPAGVREVGLRVRADFPTDVLHAELRAPDRTVALLYGRAGEQTVAVPDGLDGKVWHLRLSVGSATRMETVTPPYRYQDSPATIELHGVPGCLSPTWEQWFNPRYPVRPFDRPSVGSEKRPDHPALPTTAPFEAHAEP